MKRYLQKIRPWLLSKAGGFKYGYSNGYNYTRIFHKYDNLEAYLALYGKCVANQKFETTTKISFLKGVKFGTALKEIVTHLPSSRYEVLHNDAFKIKVLFYKLFIGEYRVKCHIHFFEEKMFLCSYTFSYLKEGEQEKVVTILQKKYLPDVPDYSNQVISDPQNYCIYVEKSAELTINYLSLNDGLHEGIRYYKEKLDRQQAEKLNAGEAEIFDSL